MILTQDLGTRALSRIFERVPVDARQCVSSETFRAASYVIQFGNLTPLANWSLACRTYNHVGGRNSSPPRPDPVALTRNSSYDADARNLFLSPSSIKTVGCETSWDLNAQFRGRIPTSVRDHNRIWRLRRDRLVRSGSRWSRRNPDTTCPGRTVVKIQRGNSRGAGGKRPSRGRLRKWRTHGENVTWKKKRRPP